VVRISLLHISLHLDMPNTYNLSVQWNRVSTIVTPKEARRKNAKALFCLTTLVKYPEPKYYSSLLCVANVRLELLFPRALLPGQLQRTPTQGYSMAISGCHAQPGNSGKRLSAAGVPGRQGFSFTASSRRFLRDEAFYL